MTLVRKKSLRFYVTWSMLTGMFEGILYFAGVGLSNEFGLLAGFLLVFAMNALIYLLFVSKLNR